MVALTGTGDTAALAAAGEAVGEAATTAGASDGEGTPVVASAAGIVALAHAESAAKVDEKTSAESVLEEYTSLR